ncbi:ParA family protein [Sessilibacter corallicola]|uniref:ParA family protein n=1 Tax=Sessilibacter corallicola TaxID=2904075 RepID=A0ABQ0AAI3_9GAMM|nr:ParA family protein [Sessilibacter corallicola]MCE2029142.1 ParA family protein [Sessilibacter corallicola]
MQVWSFANQKGGVGKTTTTVSISGLAAESGMRVLMLDLDPHGSLTSYWGLNSDTCTSSTYTLFEENKTLTNDRIKSLIHSTSVEGLDFIPSSTALATLERQAIGKDGLGLVVSKTAQLMENDYDLVAVDSPPILGVLMINALAACQKLIIPVQTEHLALKGLERMLHTLKMMSRSRKNELEYLIVPTMFDRRTHASITSLRAIKNTYMEEAWPGKIPIDTRLRDASKAGLAPHVFDPNSRGVTAYASLFKYILGERSARQQPPSEITTLERCVG